MVSDAERNEVAQEVGLMCPGVFTMMEHASLVISDRLAAYASAVQEMFAIHWGQSRQGCDPADSGRAFILTFSLAHML